jgi:hypothetical protein
MVVGPDRDVGFLFVVPIHVAEPHVEGAIRVGVVTLEDGVYTLPGPVASQY